MKKLIIGAILCMTQMASADLRTWSHDQIATAQSRPDGTYDVICKDGSREVATDLDFYLNNVCPKLKSIQSYGVLSLQAREDGQFDVMCSDLSKHVATFEQIINAEVCNIEPAIVIENGTYHAPGTSFYDQNISATYVNGELVRFVITLNANSWTLDATCVDYKCEGRDSNGDINYVEVVDFNKYKFTNDYGNSGIFEKVN